MTVTLQNIFSKYTRLPPLFLQLVWNLDVENVLFYFMAFIGLLSRCDVLKPRCQRVIWNRNCTILGQTHLATCVQSGALHQKGVCLTFFCFQNKNILSLSAMTFDPSSSKFILSISVGSAAPAFTTPLPPPSCCAGELRLQSPGVMKSGMGKCQTTGPVFTYTCRLPPAWLSFSGVCG